MIAEIVAGMVKGIYDSISPLFGRSKGTISKLLPDSLAVQQRLEEVRREINADRIYILQFHNGGYYYTGGSMQRLSCTFEATSTWVQPLIDDLQGILVTRFPTILSEIALGEAYVEDASQSDDVAAAIFFQKHGIKTFLGVAIYDLEGHFTGMIGVNYVGAVHAMTSDEKEVIHDFAKTSLGFIVRENRVLPASNKLLTTAIFLAVFSQLMQFLHTVTSSVIPWIGSQSTFIHDVINNLISFL